MMTNEQIEKRLIVDLKLGRFNISDIIPTNVYFKASTRSYKLLKVLTKIGFTLNSQIVNEGEEFLKTVLDVEKTGYVYIDLKNEIIYIGLNWRYLKARLMTGKFNRIPNYIGEYQV